MWVSLVVLNVFLLWVFSMFFSCWFYLCFYILHSTFYMFFFWFIYILHVSFDDSCLGFSRFFDVFWSDLVEQNQRLSSGTKADLLI